MAPALQADSLPLSHQGSPIEMFTEEHKSGGQKCLLNEQTSVCLGDVFQYLPEEMPLVHKSWNFDETRAFRTGTHVFPSSRMHRLSWVAESWEGDVKLPGWSFLSLRLEPVLGQSHGSSNICSALTFCFLLFSLDLRF